MKKPTPTPASRVTVAADNFILRGTITGDVNEFRKALALRTPPPTIIVSEQPEPEVPAIDWESRFHKQVSDNIKAKKVVSDKLAAAQLELDQARRTIQALERKVKRLTPAGDQLKQAENALRDSATKNLRHVNELKGEIQHLRARQAQGHQALIEDVVNWLRKASSGLPTRVPTGYAVPAPDTLQQRVDSLSDDLAWRARRYEMDQDSDAHSVMAEAVAAFNFHIHGPDSTSCGNDAGLAVAVPQTAPQTTGG